MWVPADPVAAAVQASESEEEEKEEEQEDNPLACLLGYSEGDEEEHSGPAGVVQDGGSTGQQSGPAHPPLSSGQQQPLGIALAEGEAVAEDGITTAEPGQPAAEAGVGSPADAMAGEAAGGMQAELDSFLSELKSSGLLQNEEQQQLQEGAAGEQRGDPAEADGQHPATGVAAGAGAAAEQRVLGAVPGAEGWFRALDTASGREYFWRRSTNEVAWQAPPGAEEGLPSQPGSSGQQQQQLEGQQQPEEEQQEDGQPGAQTAGSMPQRPASQAAATAGPEDGAAEGASAPASRGATPATSLGGGSALAAGQADEGDAAVAARLLAAPSTAVLETAEVAAEQCEEAAGEWLASCPRVVRLAIEARALAALLLLLSDRQAAAAEEQDGQAALTWAEFEATVHGALSALVGQVPAALEAAAQLRSAGQQQQQAASEEQQPAEEEGEGDADGTLHTAESGEAGLPPPLPPLPALPTLDAAPPLPEEGAPPPAAI